LWLTDLRSLSPLALPHTHPLLSAGCLCRSFLSYHTRGPQTLWFLRAPLAAVAVRGGTMSSRDLRAMSRRFLQVALAVAISTSVDGQVAGPGCADGSREGFVDTVTFTKIAACGGTTMGVDVTSIAASTQFCADGCVCVCLCVAHCTISPTLHELYLSHNWGVPINQPLVPTVAPPSHTTESSLDRFSLLRQLHAARRVVHRRRGGRRTQISRVC
jgi:hypothetical protein